MKNLKFLIVEFKLHTLFVDDEAGEKTVSVLLENEESEMIFIDHAVAELSVSMYGEVDN